MQPCVKLLQYGSMLGAYILPRAKHLVLCDTACEEGFPIHRHWKRRWPESYHALAVPAGWFQRIHPGSGGGALIAPLASTELWINLPTSAWATTTVAPESVRSLTTKGQMEPTFKVSLTAFESYSAWHAACHQVTWQCWHCVGISPDLYSESPDTESDYHMESA